MFITLLKIICLIDLKITLQLWWHVRTMIMCHNWMFPRFFLVNIADWRVHWHHIKIITTAWCYVILHLSTLEKNWFFSMFLKNLPTTYLPSICLNIEFSCLRNNGGRTTHRLIFLDKVFLHILPFVMIFQCNVP